MAEEQREPQVDCEHSQALAKRQLSAEGSARKWIDRLDGSFVPFVHEPTVTATTVPTEMARANRSSLAATLHFATMPANTPSVPQWRTVAEFKATAPCKLQPAWEVLFIICTIRGWKVPARLSPGGGTMIADNQSRRCGHGPLTTTT